MKTLLILVSLFSSILFAQTTVKIIEFTGSVNGISDNGIYACGFDGSTGQAFIWTETNGKVFLGANTEAYGVANDGTVAGRFLDPNTITNGNPTWVAGYYRNNQWTKLSGIPGIDPLDEQSYTHAYSINGDGNKITGMHWRPGYDVEACHWSIPDTGIELLGMTYGENSRADDISNDGSIIVGWNAGVGGSPDRTPFYWDPAPHFMGSLDSTWDGGECNGISPDGNILVGTNSSLAFQYTTSGGLQPVTDPLAFNWGGWANDVSNNGVVVGHFDPGFFTYTAFIKQPQWQYAKDLKSYLVDSLGVAGLTDYFFYFNRAVSADGKMFGGEFSNNIYPFGAAFIIKIENVVPVELTSFTANVIGSSVILNWNTSTETNNSGFEIERMKDGSGFEKIGFVPGYGTSTESRSYSFSDNSIQTGKYYYRLKQIDFNGTFEYSETIEIDINNPDDYMLNQNYPNPFNPSTTIEFSIPNAGFVNLEVYNSLGEKVAVLVNENLSAGNHSVTFNGAGLASGVYIIKMTAGNFTELKKMNLLK